MRQYLTCVSAMVVAKSATSVPSKLKCVKSDSVVPGFLASAVIRFYGKTEMQIIPKGVKVDSKYYAGKVLNIKQLNIK